MEGNDYRLKLQEEPFEAGILRRPLLALNVRAGTARFRQLSGAIGMRPRRLRALPLAWLPFPLRGPITTANKKACIFRIGCISCFYLNSKLLYGFSMTNDQVSAWLDDLGLGHIP